MVSKAKVKHTSQWCDGACIDERKSIEEGTSIDRGGWKDGVADETFDFAVDMCEMNQLVRYIYS